MEVSLKWSNLLGLQMTSRKRSVGEAGEGHSDIRKLCCKDTEIVEYRVCTPCLNRKKYGRVQIEDKTRKVQKDRFSKSYLPC